MDNVIRASKKVKSETQLSNGATSVSFAGVQYIRNFFDNISNLKILLFGLGKIGKNTCENLIKHSFYDTITLINRSEEKAVKIGNKFKTRIKKISDLNEEISQSDILFVATGSHEYTITKDNLPTSKELLILDLSLPRNVDPNVNDLPNVKLVHMDELSQFTNETLKSRLKEIPKAKELIIEIENEFLQWLKFRKIVPTITSLNSRLSEYIEKELSKIIISEEGLKQSEIPLATNKIVNKLVGQIASSLKSDEKELDSKIETINSIFLLDVHK